MSGIIIDRSTGITDSILTMPQAQWRVGMGIIRAICTTKIMIVIIIVIIIIIISPAIVVMRVTTPMDTITTITTTTITIIMIHIITTTMDMVTTMLREHNTIRIANKAPLQRNHAAILRPLYKFQLLLEIQVGVKPQRRESALVSNPKTKITTTRIILMRDILVRLIAVIQARKMSRLRVMVAASI